MTFVAGQRNGIPVYSQDPGYSDLDIELLQYFHVVVLEDADGQTIVDENTFVFAAFWGSTSDILSQCRHRQPNLYIGNEISYGLESR